MTKAQVFVLFEMKKIARSRSLLLFGVLLSVLLLTITTVQLFALPITTSFTRYSASFLNVLLLLIPLFTLSIGALSISSDVDSRWFSLLRTYPMKASTYTWGKFFALFFSFSIMLIISSGLVMMVQALQTLQAFDFLLIILSFFTVAIFSSLSVLVGSLSKNRIHSLSLALGIWAFFLLIYDYIVMAIGTVVSGIILQNLIIFLTFTNPAEWIRIGFIIFSGNSTVLGPLYFNFSTFFLSPSGVIVYGLISILWVIIPIFISGKILYRKEG
ncbi:ABC transporter permease subunit [Paenisporosarcina sp. TG-14]|uniref:ABC transporter permease subunit n=1 Tax=Paenisporosarcina sp. TG-14 TaxID=1231057 RepID=UPI0002DFC2A2|nr:ABC transporter permease subunit [Paenisporosarcina sp. TG-14]